MEFQSYQNKGAKVADKEKKRGKEGLSRKLQKNPTSPPPSSASSPSHEFSFTISLHPATKTTIDKSKPPPSFAIDLSPADDIFFHGQLLPLHLLSHPSISPRASTTSLDGLNFPVRGFSDPQKPITTGTTTIKGHNNHNNNNMSTIGTKGRNKSKYLSLFGLAKWRKTFDSGEREEKNKKLRIDVGRILRRYARVARPLLFFKGRGEKKGEFRRQQNSFSGNLNYSKWKEWGGRRDGQFSAPASMRTSPTNSGLLVARPTISSSNDSAMEEFQSAIQAAIAHCKNTNISAQEDKSKC
ncbi:BRI1 kinase inhibitor 1-like [Tasmannia lanceolata]|uniref:BRI1 kinase inhibitor 1-like n=1 Tax=Tasmannia lanceolata TaxID=3420 RepID=UPI004064C79E